MISGLNADAAFRELVQPLAGAWSRFIRFIVNYPVFKSDSNCWTWGRLLVANPRTDKPSAAVVY